MKTTTVTPAVLAILVHLTLARPLPGSLVKREVPQEHSHEQFLTTVRTSLQADNPAGISDPVFGLLGDAAAAGGAGSITDVSCLQQATADQAFTNAKAAGDVDGMTAALVYRALERNTGKVGLASAACTSIKAANPEIAAISQHQDPASTDAAATNKAITLALAKQITAVGGDPQTALKSGTFAAGDTTDNTGKGNTCDDANDATGCIFTQDLLVEDATADEVAAAAGGAAAAGAATTGAAATDAAATDAGTTASSVASGAVASAVVISTAASAVASQVATGAAVDTAASANPTAGSSAGNSQPFTGSLGGAAPPVTDSGNADRPFEVNGNTFVNIGAALQRSCDIQFNTCADAANSGASTSSVADCSTQKTACTAADAGGNAGAAAGQPAATSAATAVAAVASTSAAVATTAAATDSAAATTATTATTSSSSLDFGTCTNPTIVFGPGFDGRDQDSFEPADETEFNHGSALNIGVISSFICGQLSSKCKAGQDAVDACTQAQAAAAAQTGQAAADAFNSALGFSAISAASGEATSGSTATAGTAASGVVSSAASTATAVVAAAADPASATGAAAASTTSAAATSQAAGGNLQTFTGSLGGAATPVTDSGDAKRPFQVKADTFVNVGAALQRSCSQQFNACANAANSKAIASSVGDCQTQEEQCNAAAA
ncbi:MAG: hypothetical protein M4579_002475 [Chaenotheca gracillima]|nr:MAG: hypothetical protein M4579_002475 [Chaenotheca gracillima]